MTKTTNLVLRNGVYHWRAMINRKRFMLSTGFSNLAAAKRRAAEMSMDARKQQLGWTKKDVPTFGNWALKFLGAYHKDRETEACLMRRPMALWGGRRLDGITPADASEYMQNRQRDGAKGGTLNRELVLLNGCFSKAITEGIIEKNPFAGLKQKRVEPHSRVLSRGEEARIREDWATHVADGARWDRWLTVILHTGLRSGEIDGLCPGDVNGGRLHVRGELNKTRKSREIPVSVACAEALAAQFAARGCSKDAPYFPQIYLRAGYYLLKATCARLEITPPVSVHDLRRTFATRCAESGLHVQHLQKILGHQKIETTMAIYVHLDAANMDAAFSTLSL